MARVVKTGIDVFGPIWYKELYNRVCAQPLGESPRGFFYARKQVEEENKIMAAVTDWSMPKAYPMVDEGMGSIEEITVRNTLDRQFGELCKLRALQEAALQYAYQISLRPSPDKDGGEPPANDSIMGRLERNNYLIGILLRRADTLANVLREL